MSLMTIIYLVTTLQQLAAQQSPSQPGGFLWELFESWKPLNMTETEIIFPLSDGNNKKPLLWSAQQQHVYNKYHSHDDFNLQPIRRQSWALSTNKKFEHCLMRVEFWGKKQAAIYHHFPDQTLRFIQCLCRIINVSQNNFLLWSH